MERRNDWIALTLTVAFVAFILASMFGRLNLSAVVFAALAGPLAGFGVTDELEDKIRRVSSGFFLVILLVSAAATVLGLFHLLFRGGSTAEFPGLSLIVMAIGNVLLYGLNFILGREAYGRRGELWTVNGLPLYPSDRRQFGFFCETITDSIGRFLTVEAKRTISVGKDLVDIKAVARFEIVFEDNPPDSKRPATLSLDDVRNKAKGLLAQALASVVLKKGSEIWPIRPFSPVDLSFDGYSIVWDGSAEVTFDLNRAVKKGGA
jgi:hypothetical protein